MQPITPIADNSIKNKLSIAAPSLISHPNKISDSVADFNNSEKKYGLRLKIMSTSVPAEFIKKIVIITPIIGLSRAKINENLR